MRALFISTNTNETSGHIGAWSCYDKGPVKVVTYDHLKIRNDQPLITAAEEFKPDVIFYIGALGGRGVPAVMTWPVLRKYAPTVLLCSDAADYPWWPMLKLFKERDCFDLIVSIDGAKDAPHVDLATLTPIDLRYFVGNDMQKRDVRCGFSGTLPSRGHHPRSEIIGPLVEDELVTLAARRTMRSYSDHVRFLQRCQMVINTSHTGTGKHHHIKGRVLEAGFAGCALLENEESPIKDWFPEDCYVEYVTEGDIWKPPNLIQGFSEHSIRFVAKQLADYVHANYRPDQIYHEIVARVGLAEPRPTSEHRTSDRSVDVDQGVNTGLAASG